MAPGRPYLQTTAARLASNSAAFDLFRCRESPRSIVPTTSYREAVSFNQDRGPGFRPVCRPPAAPSGAPVRDSSAAIDIASSVNKNEIVSRAPPGLQERTPAVLAPKPPRRPARACVTTPTAALQPSILYGSGPRPPAARVGGHVDVTPATDTSTGISARFSAEGAPSRSRLSAAGNKGRISEKGAHIRTTLPSSIGRLPPFVGQLSVDFASFDSLFTSVVYRSILRGLSQCSAQRAPSLRC